MNIFSSSCHHFNHDYGFLFLQVTSDFEEDVKALPTDVNATQAYFDFIETYGTHYASVVVMGAKAVIQSQVLTK
jgi:hypothetical protein